LSQWFNNDYYLKVGSKGVKAPEIPEKRMVAKKNPTKKKNKPQTDEKPPKVIGIPFAIGNSGREKNFKTPDDLQTEIDKYFSLCDTNTKEVYNKQSQSIETIEAPIPYTIEGLCLILDCDRLTLLNYEKREGYEAYFNTIKRAKLKIQQNKLVRGLSGESNPAVSIFDLKNNHGYKDKTETEHSGSFTFEIEITPRKDADSENKD
jgi:hypothetical protein